MRVWSWIKAVIADRGEHEPVLIYLERSPDGGYSFRLGVRAGFGGQETARIPVARRTNPAPHPMLKEIHFCEIAGQPLEAANVYALQAKMARALEAIAPARTLPLCEFRAAQMDYALPVYETGGGQLTSPLVGGPKLRADDITGIRRLVCRYFESAGYVRDADEVRVGVLRPSDLRRVPPAVVFRSHSDPELWIPAVEGSSPEGPVVGVVGHAAQLRRPGEARRGAGPAVGDAAPAAPDAVALLRYLRTALERARSGAAADLHATEVRPEIWRSCEARTAEAGTRLVANLSDSERTRLELPIRRTGAGDVVAALADRGITFFLARDEQGLAAQLGRHLLRAQFLRFADEVEVEAVEPPRAERLAIDSIAHPQARPEEVGAIWR